MYILINISIYFTYIYYILRLDLIVTRFLVMLGRTRASNAPNNLLDPILLSGDLEIS